MRYLSPRKVLMVLVCLSPVAIILGLTVGNIGPISPDPKLGLGGFLDILLGGDGQPSNYRAIIWDIRMPRVVMAFLCGAALSAAGTAMQGMFRNPMADPYILGLSSGAGLGAAIALLLGISVVAGEFGTPVMAFIGALGTLAIVYKVSVKAGRLETRTMLLAGIAIGSFMSALTAFLMYIYGGSIRRLFFWMMGTLVHSTWDSVLIALPVVVIGLVVLFISSTELDATLFGEETAFHLGVDVERLKVMLFTMAALLAGVTVAFCGIIGFVGLIAPHIFRILIGPRHRGLYPVAALGGGCFLVLADAVGQLVLYPAEVPVGVITALCGAPFFVFLLVKGEVPDD